jgi:thymidine kinase
LRSNGIECRAVTSDILDKLVADRSLLSYDVIGIDEGQFFCNIDQVAIALSNHGVQVLISALNGTFDRKLFGNIYKLFPYLTSCVWKNAICVECGSEYGCYSYTSVKHDGDILIGGTDIYKALCRVCYDRLVTKG